MTFPQQTLLCLYRYDPLDRLISHTQSQASPLQRFYCKSRLATEIQGIQHHSIVQNDGLLLAQQQRQDDALDTTLLATDLQRSILQTLKADQSRHSIAYSPYGHRRPENGLLSLLGFNGERPDPVTGHYLLGNGYRAFNPVIMRFNSPDSLSPFGDGGLNSYAYCAADPINRHDPSGHASPRVEYIALKWLYKTQTRSMRRPDSFFVWRDKRFRPELLENNPAFQSISKYLGQEDMDNLMFVSKATKDNAGAASDGNLRARITGMRKENVLISSWLQNYYQPANRGRFYIPKASGIGSASFKKLNPSVKGPWSMADHIEVARRDSVSDLGEWETRIEGPRVIYPKQDEAFRNRAEDLLAERLLESIRK